MWNAIALAYVSTSWWANAWRSCPPAARTRRATAPITGGDVEGARAIPVPMSVRACAKTHVSPAGPPRFSSPATGYARRMDDKDTRQQPQTAEDKDEGKLSDKIPDALSGKGETPLGSSDEHSDAPGSTGEG